MIGNIEKERWLSQGEKKKDMDRVCPEFILSELSFISFRHMGEKNIHPYDLECVPYSTEACNLENSQCILATKTFLWEYLKSKNLY